MAADSTAPQAPTELCLVEAIEQLTQSVDNLGLAIVFSALSNGQEHHEQRLAATYYELIRDRYGLGPTALNCGSIDGSVAPDVGSDGVSE